MLAPLTAADDAWFGASSEFVPSALAGSELASAAGSPGCLCVPRLKTYFQSVSVPSVAGSHEVGSDGSFLHVVVSGPAVVSAMSRPAATMCFASPASMTIGATKSGSLSEGSMLFHVVPPSVDTLTPALGSSSYAICELSGSTSANVPSPT